MQSAFLPYTWNGIGYPHVMAELAHDAGSEVERACRALFRARPEGGSCLVAHEKAWTCPGPPDRPQDDAALRLCGALPATLGGRDGAGWRRDAAIPVRLGIEVAAARPCGIARDRRLMRKAQVNLAIHWLAGCGLHEALPDPSSRTPSRGPGPMRRLRCDAKHDIPE